MGQGKNGWRWRHLDLALADVKHLYDDPQENPPMPMLAQATLAHRSGVVANNVVNTFAIRTAPAFVLTDAIAAAIAVSNFYNVAAPGAGAALDQRLSMELKNAALAHSVKIYDLTGKLDGSPHGSPIHELLFTMNPGSGVANESYPAEVAIVATLEAVGRAQAPVEAPDGPDADTDLDRPKQRYTGRIYLGPLTKNAGEAEATTNIIRPSGAATTDLRKAVLKLDTDLRGIAGGNVLGLGVWSRKDAAMRELFAVSTDNAFDTQRRRGTAPSIRTQLAV